MFRSLCKIPPVLSRFRPGSAQLVAVMFVVHDVVFVVFQILLILLTTFKLAPPCVAIFFSLSLSFLIIASVTNLQSPETHYPSL